MREIGSTFQQCFPPDEHSASAPVFTVYTYRVIGHHKAMFYGQERDVDTVDVIDSKEYPVTIFRPLKGRLVPVPPPECLPLLGEEWRSVASV